ncbi:S9 family peptidase [Brumimicrobium aurantiacum]|uniref:S9 family peptidase n=1 Tax=Brumimicrobium aurantiacum TaxID=1737063 RepID=A0A3E1EY63_9FLAO|nr:S9 family peptidase [Brumimicrobium aurantiacum]RFC54413.1 S9 family peptidase [Brumimicrobium aurantiacum]
MNLKFFTASLILLIAPISIGQQDFSAEKLWKLKRLSGGTVSTSGTDVLYRSSEYEVDKNSGKGNYFIYDLKSEERNELPSELKSMKGLRWFNDKLAGTISEGEQTKIVRSSIHQPNIQTLITLPSDELIDFKISPEGNYLLTLQKVKTRKTTADQYPEYPEANVQIYDDLLYKHWDSWQDEYSDQLFLYEIKDGKAVSDGVNLLEGTLYEGVVKPFSGLENVTFINEEKVMYSSKKKVGKEFATSTDTELFVYDIKSKTTSNWTEAYNGYDSSPKLHTKSQQLAWLSMANDGFESDKNDIIVRDIETQEDRNLTASIDLTVSNFIWNEKGDKIYFLAVTEATYQLFELDVKSKKHRQITTGDHNYGSLALADKKIIAMRQSMLHPNEMFEVDIKTGKAKQLTHANDEALKELSVPTIEKRWITTTDNKRMLTWVILPPNFDETKKYPTLLYCQGGPQSAVSQFFSFRWNFRLMASQGYIVVAPNRRGLPGFGQQWNDAISKDWGGQSIRDYLSAIDEVSKEKYVDNDRLGAVGASYGGYSVFYLAGVHEGRFKSLIAHAGLFNMTSWYGTTEELFFANWDLGGPYWKEENKKSYEKFSPHKHVAKWDTPILIIQGGIDFRVPEGQSFEAFQAAQLQGIKSKMVYFPNENHWILSPQNAMIWQSEFFKWLDETLKN